MANAKRQRSRVFRSVAAWEAHYLPAVASARLHASQPLEDIVEDLITGAVTGRPTNRLPPEAAQIPQLATA